MISFFPATPPSGTTCADSPPQETLLNGVSWVPTGLSGFCNCLSDVFGGVTPAILKRRRTSGVTWSGRASVTLEQLPSALNSYRLRVRFDDLALEARTWTTHSSPLSIRRRSR
ncbi:MAG: hypothetical protein IPL75_03810 [Acidobacteria bacterium]|nr:hypothetical protein [Acidobacteriota bacterium]